MSVFSRLRANSEQSTCPISYSGTWIAKIFQRYPIPPALLSSQNETCDGSPKVDIRFLGIACLEKGKYMAQAAFYEITECLTDVSKKTRHDGWDEAMAKQPSDNGTDEAMSGSSTPFSPMSEVSSSSCFFEYSNSSSGFFPPLPAAEKTAALVLPPKKRRRYPVISHNVIFCVAWPNNDNIAHLSSDVDYYLFPHDAVVEAMNESPPLDKIIFSFHLPESPLPSPCAPVPMETGKRSYSTKLEEFAAVCSNSFPIPLSNTSSRRRSTDPGMPMVFDGLDDARHQAVNMCISGASQNLYLAIKQSVSGFEAICDKMMQLMRLHNQQVASQKAENGYRAEMIQKRDSGMTPLSPQVEVPPSDWESEYYERRRHRNSFRSEAGSGDEANGDTYVYSEDKGREESVDNESIPEKWAGSPSMAPPSLPGKQPPVKNTNTSVKKCSYCGSKSTPMWRRGPQGAGTLCNACGVKWKHGKILCDSDVWTERLPATKDRRTANKGERKRRKNTAKERQRAKEQSRIPSDDEVEDEKSAHHLSVQDEEEEAERGCATIPAIPMARPAQMFAVPAPRETYTTAQSEAHSLSSSTHSISESHSPLDPSPSSSPPLWGQPDHRRSLDLPIMKMMGLSDTAFSLSAGVDAVEAAAVLTLLKRS